MHMFYRVVKGIYQFSANLLSYIPTKYYRNRSTPDLVIAKSKRVNFFLKHSVSKHDTKNFDAVQAVEREQSFWNARAVKDDFFGFECIKF